MSPAEFSKECSDLYGRGWITKLAASLHVDRTTIHRILHKEVIPEKYVLALNGLKIGVAKRHR
jgi:hypothetical protein